MLSYSAKPFHEAHADDDLFESKCDLQPDWENLPPWFEGQMERLNLRRPDAHAMFNLDDPVRAQYHIVGLMRVTHRGSTWNEGPLTSWSSEGKMLMDVYKQPIDGGILKVVGALELSEPFLVKDREKVEQVQPDGRNRKSTRMFICVFFDLCFPFVFESKQ